MNAISSFTAIDFETANMSSNSICQIGLVHVKQGQVTHTINQLIQPPNNNYRYNFIRIHGITPQMTDRAPTFLDFWPQIAPYIINQNIVAHNINFDNNCLINTLSYYNIQIPNYNTFCTYKIYKKGLAKLCDEFNITLNHHDALSDANACATLFLKHININ